MSWPRFPPPGSAFGSDRSATAPGACTSTATPVTTSSRWPAPAGWSPPSSSRSDRPGSWRTSRVRAPRSPFHERFEEPPPTCRHGVEAEPLHTPTARRAAHAVTELGLVEEPSDTLHHGGAVVGVDHEAGHGVLDDGADTGNRTRHHGQAAQPRLDEDTRHALSGRETRKDEHIGATQDGGHIGAAAEQLDARLLRRCDELARQRPVTTHHGPQLRSL